MISMKMNDYGDGGKIEFDKQIKVDETLSTLCYVSLFTGSRPYDTLAEEDDQDDFEKELRIFKDTSDKDPLIASGNLLLSWMVEDGFCESVAITDIYVLENERFGVDLLIDKQLKLTLEA